MLTAANGVRVLTDPCDPSVGYPLKNIETDAITVSHSHHDHSYTEAALGSPAVFSAEGEYSLPGISIKAFSAWHDEKQGTLRGPNLLFRFEADGLTAVHLGDLGHIPNEETVSAIGKTDILMIPIGGVYTIDAASARRVIEAMHPGVVIPMHYKTKACTIGIDGIDAFLSEMKDFSVHKLSENEISLSVSSIGENRILIPDYVR